MQMLIGVTAVLAVAMFAIPAAMMAWGFEAEAERLYAKAKERERLKLEARKAGKVTVLCRLYCLKTS